MKKIFVRIIIDVLMLIALMALMAYELIGSAAHEWIGAGMFTLFIAHNILNRKWWGNILKGKYTITRTVRTIVVVLIFIGMIMQMASGIIMSRYVFAFLPLNSGMAFARTAHLVLAYWIFALMSVHLGFHGNMLMGIAKQAAHIKKPSCISIIVLRIVALFISVYGIYAFIKRELGLYMLLKNQFAFFDFNEPLILFFIDYLAIAVLFACAGHYIMQGLLRFSDDQ